MSVSGLGISHLINKLMINSGIMGFILALTPFACELMEFRGTFGAGAATMFVGITFFSHCRFLADPKPVAPNTFSGDLSSLLRLYSSSFLAIPLSSWFLHLLVRQSPIDTVKSTAHMIVAAFWLSYATTLTPFYHAPTAYDPSNPENPGFYNAYGLDPISRT